MSSYTRYFVDFRNTGNTTLLVINRFLIPDLTQLVLKYCWPKKCDFWDLCLYGNNQRILVIEKRATRATKSNDRLYCTCSGGHMDVVERMIKKRAVMCACAKANKCLYRLAMDEVWLCC